MDEPLTVEVGSVPHELIVIGELDLGTTNVLEAAIDERRASGVSDLVLEASAITFVDSRGLRTLLVALQHGSVALRNPSPQLRRLIELTGLQEHLPIVE